MIQNTRLDALVPDPRLQLRAKGLDEDHIQELMAAIKAGKDVGAGKACRHLKDIYLYDGWHRREAYGRLGRDTMPVDVEAGDFEDACLKAAAANAGHGLKRTNDDKRAAVKAVLEHSEAKEWSDRKIADYVGVGVDLVGDCRRVQVSESDTCQDETEEKTVLGRDGKRYKKKRKPSKSSTLEEPAEAETPLTEVQHLSDSDTCQDAPYPAEAAAMETLSRQLYEIAGKLLTAMEAVSRLDGPGYDGLPNRDNILVSLEHSHASIKAHAGMLRSSAPKCECVDCGGAGCIFCQHRKWQTVGEAAEGESRRKARKAKPVGAVA